jgi:hypothetical protein
MSKSITLSKKQLNAIIAAAIDESEKAKAPKAKKAKAKKAWTDKKGRTFEETKVAHFEARIGRLTELTADGRGLTKAEKSEIWHGLVEKHGEEKAKAKWGKACLKFKKANYAEFI